MSRGRTPMRKIRQVLEYRLSKNISADQTAVALSLSKGSVINYLERFERAKLAWPLPETLSDTDLEAALFPPPAAQSSPPPAEGLPDIDYLEKELAKPHMTLQRLWEEYALESRVETLQSFLKIPRYFYSPRLFNIMI